MSFQLGLAALVFGVTANAAEDEHAGGDQLLLEAQMLAPTAPPAAPAATTATARISLGEWGSIINWTPHIPVTGATLPDGRLLTFASNKRTTFPVGPEFTYAAVWDPKTGVFTEINNTRHDMFCGGAAMLKDGRVFINGGRNTTRLSSVFDWRTNSWSALPNMNDGRWYNTSVALTDGGIFTVSGDGGTYTTERWSQASNWQRLTGIPWGNVISQPGYITRWHPLVVVAPDGRLFHGGPTRQMNWITTAGTGSLAYSGTNVPGALYPKEGCFAMYDEGRLLVAGGSANTTPNPNDSSTGTSTTAAFTIDIRSAPPVAALTQPMSYARQFGNSVILPNGEVMVIGGNTSGLKFSDAGSVLTPEVWNPASGAWRDMAPMNVPRNYHSLALLLPDGRVWSGGGGLSGGSADHRDAQIFTPAPLFTPSGALAARPQITQVPAYIGTGTVFNITASAGVARFTFVKMSAQTHSVSTDLRFLELPFTTTAPGSYAITSHANLNVMTPGYWLLFALDANGVWSESRTILVDPAARVVLDSSAPRFGLLNEPVNLVLNASAPGSGTLSFSASGLPTGLGINTATGVISGVPSALGAFNTSVTATDGSSSATINFAWTIHTLLEVDPMTTSPQETGLVAAFTASFNGGVNPQFSWDFGDGTPVTAPSASPGVTHAFLPPGHYEVTVTVTDDTGRIVTQTFTQVIHAPLTPQPPAVSSSIVFEPQSSGAGRVWVVNPDHGTVTALAADTRLPIAEIVVGNEPHALALAPGNRLWVANSASDTISIINTAALSVVATLPLPRGSYPFGLALDPNGGAVYVVLEAAGQLLKLHSVSGAPIASQNVGLHARHVSVSADGGRVYVSRFITPPLPGEGTATPDTTGRGGEIVVLAAATLSTERTILLAHSEAADTPTSARGLPNYLGPVTLSPDGVSAWVPSKQDNIKRGPLRDGMALSHDQTVRSIASRLDLAAQAEDHAARVDFDDAGMPAAAAFDRWGGLLYVALESTRAVAVVNPYTSEEIARFDAGRAPQGLVLSADGRTLFVQNFMDRTVSVFDVSPLVSGASLTPVLLGTPATTAAETLSAEVLRGKQLFYDAFDNRLARHRYLACAVCHNDGGQDGRTWDLTGLGEGLRNTITLRGHGDHGPLHWTGNFDEVQDFEGQIRALSKGNGLMSDTDFHSGTRAQPLGDPKAGLSADLDALAAYVKSLTSEVPSPHRNNDGSLTAAAMAGEQIFRRQQCASCHGGAAFTRSALGLFADIGTRKPASGMRLGGALTGFDIPTLRGVWATAPYLHDGSAATLADAVSAHREVALGTTELAQLVAYLEQIDATPATAPQAETPALSGQNIGGTGVAGMHGVNGSGIHSIRAAGADLQGGSDGFYGMITRLNGDGEIRVRVTSQSAVFPNAKAGVMIRESLDGNSRHAALFITNPGGSSHYGTAWRTTTGGGAQSAAGPALNPAPDNWLRLVRAGDTVTAYLSSNSSSWSLHRSFTLSNLSDTVFIGLEVTSASPYVLGSATFDNVQILGGQFPLPDTYTAPAEPLLNGSTDIDQNGVHDLIDYAFGTAIRPDAAWSLTARPDGTVDGGLMVHSGVSDVVYALETTTNLTQWAPLPATPVMTVTNELGGTRRFDWSFLNTLPGQNAQRGILRLRVTQNGGLSTVTPPQAWQRHVLNPGVQSVGLNLLSAPLFSGFVQGIIDNGSSVETSSRVGFAAPADRCYLEVRDGPLAGHRLELALVESYRLTADFASPHSSLKSLPDSLIGARVQVRLHLTLGQVFEPARFQGATAPAQADQVLFHTATGWQAHWLYQSGTARHWVRAGDATLQNAGAMLIPPGTGLMVKINGPATVFTGSGHVRVSPFRRQLLPGNNFLASPWPLDGTPSGWLITAANGFTAGLSPATSDQIQLWNGASYDSFWLLQSGAGSILTPVSSATLNDVGTTLPLPAERAFFLKARPATAGNGWNIAPPQPAP